MPDRDSVAERGIPGAGPKIIPGLSMLHPQTIASLGSHCMRADHRVAQRPLLSVVLSDGGQLLIEAEWPNGSIEHVYALRVYFEAV
jgi:hypothetical protein